MKRKHKVWYDVTCFNQGIMYEFKRRKWLGYDEIKGCSSSHASFKTFKRAKQNAIALSKKVKGKIILMRWCYKKGVRYCQEWVIKERS